MPGPDIQSIELHSDVEEKLKQIDQNALEEIKNSLGKINEKLDDSEKTKEDLNVIKDNLDSLAKINETLAKLGIKNGIAAMVNDGDLQKNNYSIKTDSVGSASALNLVKDGKNMIDHTVTGVKNTLNLHGVDKTEAIKRENKDSFEVNRAIMNETFKQQLAVDLQNIPDGAVMTISSGVDKDKSQPNQEDTDKAFGEWADAVDSSKNNEGFSSKLFQSIKNQLNQDNRFTDARKQIETQLLFNRSMALANETLAKNENIKLATGDFRIGNLNNDPNTKGDEKAPDRFTDYIIERPAEKNRNPESTETPGKMTEEQKNHENRTAYQRDNFANSIKFGQTKEGEISAEQRLTDLLDKPYDHPSAKSIMVSKLIADHGKYEQQYFGKVDNPFVIECNPDNAKMKAINNFVQGIKNQLQEQGVDNPGDFIKVEENTNLPRGITFLGMDAHSQRPTSVGESNGEKRSEKTTKEFDNKGNLINDGLETNKSKTIDGKVID